MKIKNNWIFEGLIFGILIFTTNFLIDYFSQEPHIHFWRLLISSLIGGLVFGFIMKVIRKKEKQQ